MGYPIIEVEGIGDIYKRKLNETGISNTDELLARCRTPSHREMLAAETGISGKSILETGHRFAGGRTWPT